VARSSRAGGAIGSDDYTGFSLILIVVGLCILGWASWQVWHAQLSRIALLAAHYEMEAIGVVTDRFRPADIAVQRAHPDRVQFGQLVRLYRNIGQEFVYPAMALVLALAGLCFLRAGNARFTRTFDLEKLMAEQAIHSRSTAAFVGWGFKLSKLRVGEPRPADAALHVDEWVARYATSEKSGFDEAAARREFMRQLGGRWTGPAAASQPVRCMLAVFALQGVQRRDEAAALLGLLSEGLPRVKADGGAGPEEPLAFDPKTVAVADRVLATVEVAAWAFDVMEKHHFTTPGLMSVLNQARLRSGVLAPAQFAFLKLVGRAHCAPPSEHAGRGDRRGRPLGGRTRGRSADSDPGIRSGDRRDPSQSGLNESRFAFAPLVPMLASSQPCPSTGADRGLNEGDEEC
jgi:intracellular multiplication protein IcmP